MYNNKSDKLYLNESLEVPTYGIQAITPLPTPISTSTSFISTSSTTTSPHLILADSGAQCSITNLSNARLFGSTPTTTHETNIHFQNGSGGSSTSSTTFPLSSKINIDSQIYPNHTVRQSIANIGDIIDEKPGRAVIFTAEGIYATSVVPKFSDAETLLKGCRRAEDKLWYFKSPNLPPPPRLPVNNLLQTSTLTNAENAFLLSCILPCSPKYISHALKYNFVDPHFINRTTWNNNIPQTHEQIMRGNLAGARKNAATGKPSVLIAKLEDVDDPDYFYPPSPIREADTAKARIRIYDMIPQIWDGRVDMDPTGDYPTTSSQGNKRVVIFLSATGHKYVLPCRDHSGKELARVWLLAYDYLSRGSCVIQMMYSDNECPAELRTAFDSKKVVYSFSAPNDKRSLRAERAIRTWKNFFVAIRAGVSSDYPEKQWDLLIEGCNFYLAIVTPSRRNRFISTYADLFGQPNWRAIILAPLGCKVEVNVPSGTRTSWGDRSEAGFYLGPVVETGFRVHRVYVCSTRTPRETNAVGFLPENIKFPGVTAVEELSSAVDDITQALERMTAGPSPNAVKLTGIAKTITQSLRELTAIYDNKSSPPPSSTTSTSTSTSSSSPSTSSPSTSSLSPSTSSSSSTPVTAQVQRVPKPNLKVPANNISTSKPSKSQVQFTSETKGIGQQHAMQLRPPAAPRPNIPITHPTPPQALYPPPDLDFIPLQSGIVEKMVPFKEVLSKKQLAAKRRLGIDSMRASSPPSSSINTFSSKNSRFSINTVNSSPISVERAKMLAKCQKDLERLACNSVQTASSADLNTQENGKGITWTSVKRSSERPLWMQAYHEELERLHDETKCITFEHFSAKPKFELAVYTSNQLKVKRVDGEINRRVRTTFGGDMVKDMPGERFAPTASMEMVKIHAASVASKPGRKVVYGDISNFYLQHNLAKHSWIALKLSDLPEQTIAQYNLRSLATPNGTVYARVNKGMYGHPLAGRDSYDALNKLLNDNGYNNSLTNPSIYANSDYSINFVLIVDDFSIAYDNDPALDKFLSVIKGKYTFKLDFDRPEGNYFSGLHIRHGETNGRRYVAISADDHIAGIIKQFGSEGLKGANTPNKFKRIEYGKKSQILEEKPNFEALSKEDITREQQFLGSALWVAKNFAYDSFPAVTAASRLPYTTEKSAASNQILRYYINNPNPTLILWASDMQLSIVSDVSYASEADASSIGGGVFALRNAKDPIGECQAITEVRSDKIKIVCPSVCDAEYITIFKMGIRGLYHIQILEALGWPQGTVPIETDNLCAEGIANNKMLIKKTRTINTKFHWTRQQVEEGRYAVVWGPGKNNLANFFTKGVPKQEFLQVRAKLVHYPSIAAG
jgi:hypothetical protein